MEASWATLGFYGANYVVLEAYWVVLEDMLELSWCHCAAMLSILDAHLTPCSTMSAALEASWGCIGGHLVRHGRGCGGPEDAIGICSPKSPILVSGNARGIVARCNTALTRAPH